MTSMIAEIATKKFFYWTIMTSKVLIVSCALEVKSAIYGCLVTKLSDRRVAVVG